MSRDWQAWHRPYDEPGSHLARRLAVVQDLVRESLDRMPAGPIRAVSMCAGEGRDLLGVLADHPRTADVSARLVELDERNAGRARAAAAAQRGHIEVVTGDAGSSDAYVGAVPADLVLACGIFGNIADADIESTVRWFPSACASDGIVIWTRHRREPDLTPRIRAWFTDAGFDEISFVAPDDVLFGVGAHRLAAPPQPLRPGVRIFTFV